MPLVRPLRAWRYARTARDITPLVAPPYDVVSEDQRTELLSRDPHNAVALELPEGPLDPSVPGNRYETGARRWAEWRREGILKQDDEPGIYVLEQRFEIGGQPKTRRALFVDVEISPFADGVVLPHERTLPKALGDRFELIKATAANFSPVFALYDDPESRIDSLLSVTGAMTPAAEADADDSSHSVLWRVTDPQVVSTVVNVLRDKRLFIADGHHRYTTALAYRDLRRDEAGGQPASDVPAAERPAYDFVLMALVNMEDPELVVLPTHRLADAAGTFDPVGFVRGLEERFVVTDLPFGHPSGVLDSVEGPAFLFQARGEARPRLAVLRADVDLDVAIPLDRSDAWKRLDVAVLQELVLDPLLGIHPDRAETLERLSFCKDAHKALEEVADGHHDVAFVLRATGVEQLRAVALGGEIMPQKSTYFYPKLLSGLLFRAMD
ncbi:MAG: DUF1015 domain-containing protein [Coriobacteriales bacterium]|nr:DUF1015 domain-containing protein [Coriobacteriales bacterium]